MTRDEAVKSIKEKFGSRIERFYEKSKRRIYIDIAKDDLVDFATHVFKDMGARFNIATAVDHPKDIEIMYHFELDNIGCIITLRTYTKKDKCEIDSLLPLMKGAEWIEREIHELFGVEFRNHPNIKRLLLPDDWPKDKYPLRKDYVLKTKEDRDR
ncbi:MAG: NADH-quinone oxidoreductase subunit C [Candidatus Omnitrophica bacterium]|nr:NADH-quinone oxidoreductase subunit C [Candidatus Omnitrophota bacterium]